MTVSGVTSDTVDDYAEATESSPYHVFVAFGFAGSEVGIALGTPAVAVAGLVLFGWSVVGILGETALVDARRRARHTAYVGLAYALAAGVLVAVARPVGVMLVGRELAFAVAAGVLLVYAGYDGVRPTSA